MSTFDDFDLDLKQVTNSLEIGTKSASTIISIFNTCQSVEQPTTGMTTACCKAQEMDDDSRCI